MQVLVQAPHGIPLQTDVDLYEGFEVQIRNYGTCGAPSESGIRCNGSRLLHPGLPRLCKHLQWYFFRNILFCSSQLCVDFSFE